MAAPIDTDAAALRKKRADYMREYNRRHGAVPVKGTQFICEHCSLSIPRLKVNQKRCSACKRDARAKFHVDKRAASGTSSVGSILKCKNCSVEFSKKFKRHFYCEPCSKLSEAEMLPYQVEATRRRNAKFQRDRRRSDPKWGIAGRMSAGISSSLRDGKQGRSWESLVGYTIADLMVHLERLFVVGMSWDNRAKWHIDHKRPLASFRFETTDDPDFHKAWALGNLQPLWSGDNIRKGAKLEGVRMSKKFQITGYPPGLTAGEALVLVAKNSIEARMKAAQVLRLRGCDLPAEELAVIEDKPRHLERWP